MQNNRKGQYYSDGYVSYGFTPEKNANSYLEECVWSSDGLSYADAHIDMTGP